MKELILSILMQYKFVYQYIVIKIIIPPQDVAHVLKFPVLYGNRYIFSSSCSIYCYKKEYD